MTARALSPKAREPRPGRRVVVLAGARTPFVRAWREFRAVPAQDLARAAVVEAIARAQVRPEEVDEVILGNAGNPVDAMNIARVAALRAGLPREVPALTVQRLCGSGLEAVVSAALRIAQGEAQVVVAGGVESMSSFPLILSDEAQRKAIRIRKAGDFLERVGPLLSLRPRDFRPVAALRAGLTDPVSGLTMGQTAEVLARDFGISREEQDAWAVRSHDLAVAAEKEGRLAEERAPFLLEEGGKASWLPSDIGPREDATEGLFARMEPVFDPPYGTVTAGNSCMITDGAAALVLASEERAREFGVEPLGSLRAWAFAGVPPRRMGLGPVAATARALARAGMELGEIGLVEMNEAFAAQVLACLRVFASDDLARKSLGLDRAPGEIAPDRLNVNGGAIALGHPVGATGARLVLALLHEMRRRGAETGLATLCIGGGQGGAVILERAG